MYLKDCLLLFLLSFLSCTGGLSAQRTIVVTDDDLLSGSYLWTADNEYILDGIVVLEAGGELTIEPGTVVRGRNGWRRTSSEDGTLVIMRDARIIADGRADAPIIFTAENDDLTDPDDLGANYVARWGGLVILGNANLTTPFGIDQFADLPLEDPRFRFGGELSPDDTESSGILRYVSIRHGGGVVNPRTRYISSLTLGAIGSGTVVDHVEIFGSGRNGIEFMGGTVNAYHLVSTNSRQGSFKIGLGYQGVGQFWLGMAGGVQQLDIYGSQPAGGLPFSSPDLANLTLVSTNSESFDGASTSPFAGVEGSVLFQGNASGNLENTLFVHAEYDEYLDKVFLEGLSNTETGDAYARWEAGDLTLTRNYFSIESGGPLDWSSFAFVLDENRDPVTELRQQPFRDYMAGNNTLSSEIIIASSDTVTFDPLPLPGTPVLTGGTPITRPGFTEVPYQGAFGTENWMDWTFLGGSVTSGQFVTGRVLLADDACTPDALSPAAGVTVTFINDGITRYTTTDTAGRYRAFVPLGRTLVSPLPPSAAWEACLTDVTVEVTEGEVVTADLALNPTVDCALPSIDIGAQFLRRGFTSNYHVTYVNNGTVATENLEATVILDSLRYQSSSIPLTEQRGDTLVFALDDLPPLSNPSTFSITVFVGAGLELGREHCTTAIINASNMCGPFGGAELRVSGECIGDSVRFEVRNVGDAEPQAPIPYIVIEDEVMLISEPFSPAPGTAEEFFFPANNQTFNFSTLARPDDVRPGSAAATISCGDTPDISFSSFATPGSVPNSAVDCQPNIGSYDPNDKAATPTGVTSDNIVPENVVLDYRIRFQNTGTDTAFTVVVVDTLPAELDPATFSMGTFSHPCTWTLDGERTLRVTFENIMLPDSNVNEPASNGFFYFTIAARAGLDLGTEIRNEADIYFDFNQPILTNQTYHRIDRLRLKPVGVRERDLVLADLRLFPQPAGEEVFVELETGELLTGSWTIFSIDGRLASGGTASGVRQRIPLNGLPPGVYLLVLRGRDGRLLGRRRLVVR